MLTNLRKINLNYLIVVIFLTVGAYFRFTSLGYSDLQGDEVKPFAYRKSADLLNFLLGNSKGPGQYLIVKLVDTFKFASIDSEFWYRLPFALAGFLALCFFYFISKKFFGSKVGINVLVLAIFNGFFIAFSRIIQYQSFEILFSLLSTFFFLSFFKDQKRNSLIISGVFAAVGLLFHFDALGFIIPQLILLFLTEDRVKNYTNYIYGLSFALIFYVPYVFNEKFPSTLNYILKDRTLSGFSYDSVFYSTKLSTIYFSKEYLIIIFFLLIVGLWNLKIKSLLKYRAILTSLVILVFARYFVGHPSKTLTILSLIFSLDYLFIVFINKEIDKTKKYFLIWFIVSFTVYILLISKPLTHIYNVFIPLTFLAGFQLTQIKNKYIKYGALFILVLSSMSFNYQAYIENNVEYPWQSEKYIFGDMYEGISQGEVVRGIFGFPYYRSLDKLDKDLGSIIDTSITPTFSTNIKYPRLAFYIRRNFVSNQPLANYYIEIKNDRDYEGDENKALLMGEKAKLIENDHYIIYKLP